MARVVGHHTSRHESRTVHIDAAAVGCCIVINEASQDVSVFTVHTAAAGGKGLAGAQTEVAVAHGAVAQIGIGIGHVYTGSTVGLVVVGLRLRLASLDGDAFEVYGARECRLAGQWCKPYHVVRPARHLPCLAGGVPLCLGIVAAMQNSGMRPVPGLAVACIVGQAFLA